jgi:iron complex transport system substrate-binding protein
VRIVSLLPSATDIIFELGLLDWLVGVSEDCDWPAEVRSRPLVARNRIDLAQFSDARIEELVRDAASDSHSLYVVDADLLAELQPELVLTQDVCAVCAVSSGDLASACPLGVEVYSMNPSTLEDVIASVVALAERLGVRERGLALAERMRAKIEATRAAVADLEGPRVFMAEWIDPPYNSGHWLPEMVELAGGSNLLSRPGEYSTPTTWDAALAEEPDMIVIAACGFGLDEAAERAADLHLPVRTVVVNGGAHYSRPAPRLADGVQQLGHLLHPDVAPDPGLPHVELALATARGR